MKKPTVRILSFTAGLALAAVVIGVALTKNPALRREVDNQVASVLKATRSLTDTYKNAASKAKAASSLIKKEPEDRAAADAVAAAREEEKLAAQWDAVEKQLD